MDISHLDYSQIIIDTINKLLNSLFESIDNTLFELLDNIVFIDTSILKDSFFEKAFGSSYTIGIISIANALLFGFVIYYCIKLLLSSYTGTNIEKPYNFIFKIIIFTTCINCSHFICDFILYINSLVCDSIREIGSTVFNVEISFNSLISQMNSFISIDAFNLFSFEGFLRGFISINMLNLLLSYSLRYILLKVFILLTPFSFLSLITSSTSWFFKTWLRNLLSLLLLQSFVALIFLILFSFDGTFSTTFSQLMYLGTIYALTKSNHYIRELIGGISTDFNLNIGSLRSLLK